MLGVLRLGAKLRRSPGFVRGKPFLCGRKVESRGGGALFWIQQASDVTLALIFFCALKK
jgi:hypothetical protein